MSDWYKLDATTTLQQLGVTAAQGLSDEQAARRLGEHGPNELIERGGRSPWRILWEQLTATMVVILIVAAIVSALLGDAKDAIAILAIVVLYAILGFTQEYRAEKAMAALKQLAVPVVRVRRAGELRELSARELVPGDVLLLEAGNVVPADVRLLEAVNLRIQEATLTGESEPVEKHTNALAGIDLPLGDRRNMGYMGTIATYGRGIAVVVQTGMQTELGHIASMIQGVSHSATPLQRRLDQLGRVLAVVAVVIAGLVFGLGLLRGEDARLMFMTAVSVAVAAVPEGLPAVVTITLALGARRMLKRNALIRKLPAVETLGSVTVICSDKTGTLTENRMTVTVLDVAGHRIDLTEDMLRSGSATAILDAPERDSASLASPHSAIQHPSMSLLLTGGALCNDAVLNCEGESGRYHTIGDPTEGALVMAAARLELWKDELDAAFPRVAELPFDSERKRMTTVHRVDKRIGPVGQVMTADYAAFTKGSVDGLLQIAQRVWVDGQVEPLEAPWRDRIEIANMRLAQNGMRVLGVAFKPLDAPPSNGQMADLENDLIFVGLVGMIDPPRAEVQAAVRTAQTAGIRPVMITGDHPLTARHIARELGIGCDGPVLTGQELDRMSPQELERVVEDVSVYARVSPEHKLKIVQALQTRGHIVAMTGDGVNDAPALKKADIGVAMGITGTDVSKEAADVVLRDDNFATIVAAVQEGRTIYDNVRKFIEFSIAGNVGKILVVLVAPLLGMPLPLLPLQLLWLNLLTDGLLGLGLGVEPAERDTMLRPPYSPQESVLGRGMGRHIVWVGLLIGLTALGLGYAAWQSGSSSWQTMVFTVLALLQIGQAMAIRSRRDSLVTIGLSSNRMLLGTALLVFVLQMVVILAPPMQAVFGTQPLTGIELFICLALGTLVFVAVEIEKWVKRRTRRAANVNV